jgi:hypothetical protein
MSSGKTIAAEQPSIDAFMKAVVNPLQNSSNPNDRRKGHDAQGLLSMQQGLWSGRFALTGAAAGPRRTLCLSARMQACGLTWDGSPQPHDTWNIILAIANNYPLAAPAILFVDGPTPFNPHVLHKSFVPNRHGLSAELQQFLSDDHDGACCYTLSSDWSTSLDHDLVLVCRQVSRILVGSKLHGERNSINAQARDYYLKLHEMGHLPLGPALPLPAQCAAGAKEGEGSEDAADNPAIELVEVPPDDPRGQ